MPRTVPTALAADLAHACVTTCRLLKIAPRRAPVFGMTSLDVDVVYDDGAGPVTYVAANGFDAFDVQAAADLSVNNSQASALASQVFQAGMTADGVARGDYDDAAFVLYLVNYRAPSHGAVILQTGRIGQVTMVNDALCRIELRGLIDILKQTNLIGLTSITDRAMLGDDHNKLPLRWYAGAVASVGAEADRSFASAVAPGSNSGTGGGITIPLPGGDLAGWTAASGDLYQITNDPRYQYLEAGSDDVVAYRDVPLPSGVTAGDTLTASCLVQGGPGAGRTVEFGLGFGSAASATTGAVPITAAWVSQAVSAAVPAGATSARLFLTIKTGGSKVGMNVRAFSIADGTATGGAGTGTVAVIRVPFYQGDGTTKTATLLDPAGEPLTSGYTVSGVQVDGAALASGAWSDNGSGLITFTTAPASGAQVTWTGTLVAHPTGYFAPGVVHWDSGWNIGLEREVESYDAASGTVTLAIPCPFAIRAADTFRIRRDYDGSMAQAQELGCLLNFRGEPWIPRGNAIDLMAPTPQS